MPAKNIFDSLTCLTSTEMFITALPLRKVKNSYKVTKFSLGYTLLGMLTVLVGLFVGIRHKMMTLPTTSVFANLSPLAKFVGFLEIFMSVLTYIVSNLCQQFQKGKHIELIDQLHKLDATLIKKFNIKMNYHKMVRKNGILIILFLIYYTVISFTVLLKIVQDDFVGSLLLGICYIVVYMAPGVTSYAAMNFANLLSVRFRLLQKLLDPNYMQRKYRQQFVRVDKIRVLIHGYHDMFKIIKKVSRVYGVSLLMVHFHDLTFTTSQMYFVFWKSTDSEDNSALFVHFFFWMLPTIWKLFLLPLYMHLMMNDAEACIAPIIHADDHTPTEAVRDMMEGFTKWNRHNNTRVSISGLFESDLTLAFSMCCGVASYLLVLIQFQDDL